MKVHIVRRGGTDTVVLHLVPVAWFVSMRFANTLNIDRYEGEERRLVGTEQIPLAELTPEFVRARVEKASAEYFGLAFDPQAVSDFLERCPRPQMRDIDGAA